MNKTYSNDAEHEIEGTPGRALKTKAKTLPAITMDGATLLTIIERAATNPDVDIDKMERLLAIYEKQTAKTAEMEFNVAMTRCQKAMRTVVVDKENSHTHSKYASYDAIDKVLRPIYTRNGFSLSYNTRESVREDILIVLCRVSHIGGHSEEYSVPMPVDGKGAQGSGVMTKTHASGAGMAYGMRYLIKMIFNVAVGEDDTDGNPPPDANTITANQVKTIESLLKSKNLSEPDLLKYLKVTCLERIKANAYQSVITLLKQKEAKK